LAQVEQVWLGLITGCFSEYFDISICSAMKVLLALSVLCFTANAEGDGRYPGGYTSISESVLKRGASTLVPKIVSKIKGVVIPGVNKSLFAIDPIRFEDVSIGNYDVSVLSGNGVQVTLSDMSNVIAHTNIMVNLKLIKCTGQIWATATGASYKAINQIVVDKDGNGKLQTVTRPGEFNVGDIQVHHKMDGFFCEAAGDVLHVVNAVVIDLIKNTLQEHLAGIIAKAVDVPSTFLIHEIEDPPALGFGKEKFQLDNSYLGVSYDGHRITHLHKGEFKSTLHPLESPLIPPPLRSSGERDVQFGFSDYMMNTLFDALFAEHVGESQLKVPFVKTIFDKECPKCPIVLKSTFGSPARQTFSQGMAQAHLTGINLQVAALRNTTVLPSGRETTEIFPLVTLSVNATAGVAFSLENGLDPLINPVIKAAFSLQKFEQEVVLSHIGKIDMSDLTRDINTLLTSAFNALNQKIPGLPLPAIAGVSLEKPVFSIDDRKLLLEADLMMPQYESTPSIVIV